MKADKTHRPVLVEEVIDYLKIGPTSKVVDATLNGGGHSAAILERYPTAKILGIEYDPDIFQVFQQSDIAGQMISVNDSYANLKKIAARFHFEPDAILFDLGVSSFHYLNGRGFTFGTDEPLDMRFNPDLEEQTAAGIVNKASAKELERILIEYGEEKFSKNITQSIIRRRSTSPILRTQALVEAVNEAVPDWYKHKKIHPATKTFQALRIAVNHELEVIKSGLRDAVEVLVKGGRLIIISFHGLEDKLVREFIKSEVKNNRLAWVTKETIRPRWSEIKLNPRARSAKMKIVEKI